ncbi:MAG: glucans biosynthesis glucosyltransferase MdoH, partial [Myxococcota bacterium]
ILRVRAFAESARLPILSGKAPWGGSVLSHDFIEAAMLRRHGWGVRIDDDLDGSYEGAPPSLTDVFVRDRRWCQGNLQHSRFVCRSGYRLLSRIHLLTGIYSYVGAVVWFAMIIVGLSLAVQAVLTRPEYFAEPGLLPTWPVFESERAIRLFLLSMGIVLWPKLLGALAVLLSWKRLWSFGGPLLIGVSTAVETFLSALYAPMMMVAHCQIVVDILRGRDSGWAPQRREDGSIGFFSAIRDHWVSALLGLFLGTVAWLANPWLLAWLLPISAGLILAGPLSWISASRNAGRFLQFIGVLRSPDERWAAPVVRAYRERLASFPAASAPSALSTLANDPDLLAWHMAQVPAEQATFCPERVLAFAKAEQSETLEQLEAFLTPGERLRLLENAKLPTVLHRRHRDGQWISG